jgi:hypothetical protein
VSSSFRVLAAPQQLSVKYFKSRLVLHRVLLKQYHALDWTVMPSACLCHCLVSN